MEFAITTETGPADDVLWSRVRIGDQDALGELFRRHAVPIYNYCFRRLGDWGAAEDMVSIVFLEAWRKRDTVIRPGKVLPWLYGVATNASRNRRRSERRYASALRRLPAERPTPDLSDDAGARIDDEQQMRSLLAQISRLSRGEQDVLALCAWSELSYGDAASALGIPVGTVRSRLSRARAHLTELELPGGHEQSTSEWAKEVQER